MARDEIEMCKYRRFFSETNLNIKSSEIEKKGFKLLWYETALALKRKQKRKWREHFLNTVTTHLPL